ncbi:MAG: hypothetical protein K2L56_08035 [Prevotella sp.]|nr:hypothetical protein [Prevotella sp.]
MKQIARYVLTAAMMLASALGAQAQTDPDATIKAVGKIVNKHGDVAEHFISKEIYPKYRKDAKVLTGIARAYNQAPRGVDSSYVFNYIRKAIEIDPNYAPAYVIGGTELRQRGDTVAAFEWYDRAIKANPKDPDGYLKYAQLMANKKYSKCDLEGAVRKLEELANINPEANIYVEVGRLYIDAGGMDYIPQAIDAYAKADVATMTPAQVSAYVYLLQAAGASGGGIGSYNRSDSVLSLALAKYPSNAELNQLMLQNSVKLGKYEQALDVANTLFNKSDSLEIDFKDFINYGDAYLGLKRYDDAIAMYKKCVDYEIKRSDYKSDESYENMKRQEDKQKSNAMKKIVGAYKKKGYIEEAIEEYKKYMAYMESAGKLQSLDLNELAKLYVEQSDFLNGAEKLSAYTNAFDTFDEMAKLALAEDLLDNYAVARMQRIMIATKVLDEGSKSGLCISDAEQTISLFYQRADLTKYSKLCLENSLQYMGYYHFLNSEMRKVGKYWKMLGQVNPDNSFYLTLDTPANRRKMGIR